MVFFWQNKTTFRDDFVSPIVFFVLIFLFLVLNKHIRFSFFMIIIFRGSVRSLTTSDSVPTSSSELKVRPSSAMSSSSASRPSAGSGSSSSRRLSSVDKKDRRSALEMTITLKI